MKTALIIIDLQNDFFRTEYEDQDRAREVEHQLTENINRLLETVRHHQIPVFSVLTSLKPDGSNWNLRMKDLGSAICIQGTDGEAIIPGIKTDENDHIIKKIKYSAFFNTNLHETLQSMAIDTLIMGGINTHACIRTSAVDAFMRDYRVFIPEECVASYDHEYHTETMKYFSRRIAEVLPLDELIQRIINNDLKFYFTN